MLIYLMFAISLVMAVASLFLYHHRHRAIVRGLGILLAYLSSAVALKIFYMIFPR